MHRGTAPAGLRPGAHQAAVLAENKARTLAKVNESMQQLATAPLFRKATIDLPYLRSEILIFLSIEDARIGTEAVEIAKLDLVQIRLTSALSEHDLGADWQQVVMFVDHYIVVVDAH